MTWRMLDTFSGIGGFSLAAAWTGRIETVQFIEIDGWCRRVLAKHWPEVPIHDDIRTFTGEHLQEAMMRGGPPRKDYSEAVRLYESGSSLADVARHFGKSRRTMQEALLRRGVEMRPQLRYGEDNHFYRGGARADGEAANKTEYAVRTGQLVPQACEGCGAEDTLKGGRRSVQAHHDDYNKPLDVRWFCPACHHAWHKTNTPIGKEVMPTEAPARIDLLTGGFP